MIEKLRYGGWTGVFIFVAAILLPLLASATARSTAANLCTKLYLLPRSIGQYSLLCAHCSDFSTKQSYTVGLPTPKTACLAAETKKIQQCIDHYKI